MHLTLIHPAIGHKKNCEYIRTWQMESLPMATIAGLMPEDVFFDFYDDRLEEIPYDLATDAVVITVETYTAKRAYQIASEYRKRHIPVIMGGFHATLMTEEVGKYAEAVVVGEAELIWLQLVNDLKSGNLQARYQSNHLPALHGINPDRSIFRGKRYLPIGLIETGRGCCHACDFCSVASFFKSSRRSRPVKEVIREIQSIKNEKKVFFFVDDNFISDIRHAKELLRALIPLKIRWITQMSIDAARDRELLLLMCKSGCMGVLIGFETLNPENLVLMNKKFNNNYDEALDTFKSYNIRIYATFIFGYDHDTADSFEFTVRFAIKHKFYIAAFNHLTPFPATPLYDRLRREGRMLYDAWWLDDRYRYNDLPFTPLHLTPEDVTRLCVKARREFYSVKSIGNRFFARENISSGFMLRNYLPLNWMHRNDVDGRNGYPLGNEMFKGKLIEVGNP